MNFLRENIRLIALVAPLVVFFALGALIPHQASVAESTSSQVDPSGYLALVIARVLLIGAVLAFFWRYYLALFPLHIDRWGWLVGMVGGVLWIVVCGLDVERTIVSLLGLSESILGSRSSVDPYDAYPIAGTRHLFLAFRFSLLVLVVPIAEELFLRGFLMRVVDSDEWLEQPLNQIGRSGLVTGTLYGMLTHPSEFVAAAIWFTMVTVLMVRTGRFWNCVVAHAVTNLILGLYVCYSGSWRLW